MGDTAREIVGPFVDEILKELNRALADEWLALIQYTTAMRTIRGKMAYFVAKEHEGIAKEELEHVEELLDRIVELGGKPLVSVKEILEETNCGFREPGEDVCKVLEDLALSEKCAIKVYDRIAKMSREKDPVTYALVLHILEEEIRHEQIAHDLYESICKK